MSHRPARPATRLVAALAVAGVALAGLWPAPPAARANTAYQPLPFTQSWSDTALIGANDDWGDVPGIVGYAGNDLLPPGGSANDPRLITDPFAGPPQVFANQPAATLSSGGVAEFELANPAVALQGSNAADAPHLLIHLNTLGYSEVRIQYKVRDLDASIDDAVQQVALQYRLSESGPFINIGPGYIADATSAGEATRVSTVDVAFGAIANKPQVQLRIITTNVAANDEWVGIDDLSVTGTPAAGDTPPTVLSAPPDGGTGVDPNASITLTFSEAVNVGAGAATLACGGNPVGVGGIPAGGLSNVTTVTLDPAAALPVGATCELTLAPAQIVDRDGTANQLAGNSTVSFTVAGPCDGDVVRINKLQGAGAATPCATRTVKVRGVVVGDFEGGSDGSTLRGFYVQEEAADQDADPATSEGIFVFNALTENSVDIGDLVEVSGQVAEFQGQTQITLAAVAKLGTGTVAPTSVQLPVPADVGGVPYLERFEGMLVRFPQQLYVTEHFQLGRFGQVLLSAAGRLRQPTHIASPGAAAQALQEANDRNQIVVDDELQAQNPDPIRFGRGGNPLSAANTLRGGDTVSDLVGVLGFNWGGNSASPNAYRVRPVGALGGAAPNFQAANPRPAQPPAVGGGIRVAGFNLLNYFNTFSGCTAGAGGAATDCRGANNQAEFDRQRAKTIQAIRGLDADIVGLVELENDGYAPAQGGIRPSAIIDLVNGLNAAGAPGDADDYTFVGADAALGQQNALGTDAIKVGLIYRYRVVEAFGSDTWTSPSQIFERRPLVQSFRDIRAGGSGQVFSVAVNHFKSKSCDGASGADADQGDGQGCFNARRTQQAEALIALLRDTVVPGAGDSGDPDVLIVGDLNAYAKEDPIAALAAAGYVDLVADRVGQEGYSYVFDGQWGYLDYALASAGMERQVSGVAEWHINADEPSALDYNTDFKSTAQQTSLYAADQYRTSDHDPVLVGLDLSAPPANRPPTLTTVSTIPGAQAGQPFTLTYAALAAAANEADPDGDSLRFRVEAVSAGTLTKDGAPVTPGTTTLGPDESLVYTPAAAGSAVAGFTVVAFDGVLASATPVAVRFDVAPAGDPNRAPTLTTVATIEGALVGEPFTLSYDTLAAVADEADPDGDTVRFRVEQLVAGTLTKGGAPVVPGVTTLGPGESLVYTPGAAGSAVAGFDVVAFDGALVSSPAVTVSFLVNQPTPGNRPPSLTVVNTIAGLRVGQAFTLSYDALAAAANESDPDGDVVRFRVQQVSAGTLTKGGAAITPGVTTLAPGESLVYTPAGAGASVAGFSVVAFDGELASNPPVVVRFSVAPNPTTNRAPTLTTIAPFDGLAVGRPFGLTYAALAAAANEADPDGDQLVFRVQQVLNGRLTKGGAAVTPGVTTVGPGESLVYTPDRAGSSLAGFTLAAFDGALASSPAVAVRLSVRYQLYLPAVRR